METLVQAIVHQIESKFPWRYNRAGFPDGRCMRLEGRQRLSKGPA